MSVVIELFGSKYHYSLMPGHVARYLNACMEYNELNAS